MHRARCEEGLCRNESFRLRASQSTKALNALGLKSLISILAERASLHRPLSMLHHHRSMIIHARLLAACLWLIVRTHQENGVIAQKNGVGGVTSERQGSLIRHI